MDDGGEGSGGRDGGGSDGYGTGSVLYRSLQQAAVATEIYYN